MQKTAPCLLALGFIVSFIPIEVLAIVKITAYKLPAWVQQDNTKTELRIGDDLEIGDQVITGNDGRVEMQPRSNTTLRLYPNSEMGLLANPKAQLSTSATQPVLHVKQGRVCVESMSELNSGNILKLKIGKTIVSSSPYQSHICLLREDGLSSIELREGSVQVLLSIDQSTIILSRPGTELRINDDGSYEILGQSEAASISTEDDELFITDADASSEDQVTIPPPEDNDVKAADQIVINDPELSTNQIQSDFIYTVYLFSTRSEDVANEVNQRFQKAGHNSKIIISDIGESKRYRIAVSGFKSQQSAKQFARAMAGKLGVRDTWIGKDRQQN
jgi:hypothetical protein